MKKCIFAFVLLALTACAPKTEPLPPKAEVASIEDAVRAVVLEGYLPKPVSGWSMHPWIPGMDFPKVNAYVGTTDTPFDELKRGHVVVYRYGNTRVIHRLGQKTSRGWVVYGIGNEGKDSVFVTQENYVERVVYVAVVKR